MSACPQCNAKVPLTKLIFRTGNRLKCNKCGVDLVADIKNAKPIGAIIGLVGAGIGVATVSNDFEPFWIIILVFWITAGPIVHSLFTNVTLAENKDYNS